MVSGIIASPGLASGKALLVQESVIPISRTPVAKDQIQEHIRRFQDAKNKTIEQLQKIKIKALKTFGVDKAQIFEAHLMLVEDDALTEEILDRIKSHHENAGQAVDTVIHQTLAELGALADDYFKERAADIKDIGDRILRNLLGLAPPLPESLADETVIIAEDLSPSQTAQMDMRRVTGLVTERGGPTSHVAILARSLEIPAVVGTKNITKQVSTGDNVLLDAVNNLITINPTPWQHQKFMSFRNGYLRDKQALNAIKELPAVTADGHRVALGANIGGLDDLKGALRYGAEAVGLFRTEFLFMNRNALPSEEEQFTTYRDVARKMQGKPVLIRILDIGGDKPIPYLAMQKEDNPFLGHRAIRFCLDEPHILLAQIRAILRAGAFGLIKILFPMIISVGEVRRLKAVVDLAKEQLLQESLEWNPGLEIGIIIETPAAVMLARHLIEEVDFFSIGTNDLTQYTLAVDRCNEKISHLYRPLSPAVLALIHKTVEASHRAGKWTGVCGEMASDPRAVLILLGLGVDELSMSAASLLPIKQIIRNSRFDDLQKLALTAIDLPTSKDVEALLDAHLARNGIVS